MKDLPFQTELVAIVKEKWRSPLGLLAILGLGVPVFAVCINFVRRLDICGAIALCLLVFATVLVWIIKRKCPKNVKGKVGIIIAITTENKNEHLKLKSDLISQVKNTIRTRGLESVFNVIELPEYYAAEIQDYPTSLRVLEGSKAHFIIYGVCKRRMEGGKEHYFIASEAAVIHKPIPKIVSNKLSKEFAELFPRRVAFPIADEISGFEITREWVGVVSRYIIGIASFLSGDFKLSFNLFEELRNELTLVKINIEQIKKLRLRLPQRISESALALASRLYFIYRRTKDDNLLTKMKPFLDILKNIDPNNYSAHLLRGIYLFLVERNIEEAKKEIKRSQNHLDATWRYSEAFLYAYEGNLDKAEGSYKKAFRAEVTSDVIFQTEEFIHDVLEIEPQRCQLWYCLGMINWKAKRDNILAKEAFEKFLSYCNGTLFLEQRRKVREYLKHL